MVAVAVELDDDEATGVASAEVRRKDEANTEDEANGFDEPNFEDAKREAESFGGAVASAMISVVETGAGAGGGTLRDVMSLSVAEDEDKTSEVSELGVGTVTDLTANLARSS